MRGRRALVGRTWNANGTWYNMPGSDGTDTQVWQPTEAGLTDTGDTSDGFDPVWRWGVCMVWRWVFVCFGVLVGLAAVPVWALGLVCRIWLGVAAESLLPRMGIWRRRWWHRDWTSSAALQGGECTDSGPGGVHPIHRIRTNPVPPRAVPLHHDTVMIAGVVATPLQPVGQSFEGSGGVVGGALYRDYPVETVSKRPVLGIAAKPVSIDDDLPVSGWVGRASLPRSAPVAISPGAPVASGTGSVGSCAARSCAPT